MLWLADLTVFRFSIFFSFSIDVVDVFVVLCT